ncbi:MAG: short-chain fatty acyl-CoA regulator family protein, partial [Pseudomonadota bacterium]
SLARDLDVDFPILFRRLASLPGQLGAPKVGLVIVDGAGRLVHRQPCDGFDLPRAGFGCALWPVFSALQMPQISHHSVLTQIKRAATGAMEQTPVVAFAVAERISSSRFDRTPLHRALMLLVPDVDAGQRAPTQTVGLACRVCQSATCFARSEPSILKEEF